MNQLIEAAAFHYDKLIGRLIFNSSCRLLWRSEIDQGKNLLRYLDENRVSSLQVHLQGSGFFDLNSALLFYQIVKLFAKDRQKSLVVFTRDDVRAQRQLIEVALKLDPRIKLEFTFSEDFKPHHVQVA